MAAVEGMTDPIALGSSQAEGRRACAAGHTWGDEPDLLGHAYLVIVDTPFQAMMDGEDATVAALFPEAVTTAPRASGAPPST